MPSPIPPGNLPPELQRLAEELAQQAQPDQLAWLGGYFTGLAGAGGVAASPAPSPGRTLTILFGSQTGNSEGIANDALARARERGIPAVVKDMNDYKTATLRKETDMMVVISTHGEGDPPDTAIEFF